MLQRLSNPWEGIDFSKWQGAIDFIQVKASGKKFVLIRAGYGRKTVNGVQYGRVTKDGWINLNDAKQVNE